MFRKLTLSLVCLITLENGLFAEDKNKSNNGEYFANLGLEALEKEDRQKAKEYLQKAKELLDSECNKGMGKSCFRLGELYLNNKMNILNKTIRENLESPSIAKVYFQKGCNRGYQNSCYYAEGLSDYQTPTISGRTRFP